MTRRPSGQVAPMCLWVLAFLLPWLSTTAVAQLQQIRPGQFKSPSEGDGANEVAATLLTGRAVETAHIHERLKTTMVGQGKAKLETDAEPDKSRPPVGTVHPNSQDASAPALAPDLSVRAPPPSDSGVGLSQQVARSLEDWEVEDYVLLATVDGDLYASDRKTGDILWHVEVEQPMVESRHYRLNNSVLDDDYSPIDHYIWVVEPDRDGELYLWTPATTGAGLIRMCLTMKQMVDRVPFHDRDKDLYYTGNKKTTLITLNVNTGRVIKWFSSGESQDSYERCLKPTALVHDEECSNSGTVTLGRTEYTVDIHRSGRRHIATLTYSEWGPNQFDKDLMQQNRITKDNRYMTTQHDGHVYGFDYGLSGRGPFFTTRLASPVAKVFDVFHRWGVPSDLVVLPQPPPPPRNEEHMRLRTESVFVNHTEAGSWYALSGSRYPLILDAPRAPVHTLEPDLQQWSDSLDASQISLALIGRHHLPVGSRSQDPTPLIEAPHTVQDSSLGRGDPSTEPSASPEPSRILEPLKRLPEFAAIKVFDLISNPAAIVLFLSTIFYFQKDIVRWVRARRWLKLLRGSFGAKARKPKALVPLQESIPHVVTMHATGEDAILLETCDPNLASPTAEPSQGEVVVDGGDVGDGGDCGGGGDGGDGGDGTEAEIKKKKGHRGVRGGKKHKKGRRRDVSLSREDDTPPDSLEEVVNKAKLLGIQPRLEPDIQTVTNGVEEVSGPILKMGSLEVNQDQQLGTGSNGTVVFAGKWDGRDVAVKRMLIQFNEIASRETKLLRESDDHPNVIRYFAQEQRAAFLYIALELCQASLADVITRPGQFPALVTAGERDMPGILYQVTNGLSHLHSLRIVHRDLKPQNILINMGKDGRPRLVVSDFGLCKKLEGGQSSFGATTAHAAGTSGWRAPELLLDDDSPGYVATPDPASSLHSGSSPASALGPELFGPNSRRVTRAIDIFSLGLVFFYVLTKGNHPFDCGDRYMREVNIRKGRFNLDLLEALGDYKVEAFNLVDSMLNMNPRLRPTARDVMSHPFFWKAKKRLSFLCDVSDHFEKESRDPPSVALQMLEREASTIVRVDFLKHLPRDFIDSLGKQRKYTGTRLLDLLRALRNKKNHFEDMPDPLKRTLGPLPDGYLGFWSRRFPDLLITCWRVVEEIGWDDLDRFREYYQPAAL